jgi:hypothetical protein
MLWRNETTCRYHVAYSMLRKNGRLPKHRTTPHKFSYFLVTNALELPTSH